MRRRIEYEHEHEYEYDWRPKTVRTPDMTLSLHNTLTRQKEPFSPLEPGVVRMYNCGPTVYSAPHIGNFRSFLYADTLRRWLEYRGFEVRQVMNITDVGHLQEDADEGEDKLEAAARKEKKDPWEISRRYAAIFLEMSAKLGMRAALKNPHATDHIPEMIEIIQLLLARGHAYVADGEVYYDVLSFPGYGRLSGNTLKQLEAGHRVEVNPKKRNPLDFALWKADPKHIMQWDSPWGRGFPGWHIECSAMARKYLGDTLDLHTGGEDNIFPHHESEIAQSEGATGKPFVRTWGHARHLLVDGEKMAKSKGNFHTCQDLLDRGFAPRVLRYALIKSHYRQPLNFTIDGLESDKAALARVDELRARVAAATGPGAGKSLEVAIEVATGRFEAAMDDDLNVSEALSAVFGLVSEVNRMADLSAADGPKVAEALSRFDRVLGVFQEAAVEAPAEVQALVQAREAARKAKDWAESDRLRKGIAALGWEVKDTPQGARLRRL